jgi:D-alanine-D-alanine ligase
MSSDHIRALHLLGSSASEFYFDLSVAYGRTCAEFEGLSRDKFTHNFAVVHPSGEWSFPASMDSTEVAEAPRMNIADALQKITQASPAYDLVVPHMFCVEGMTKYRGLMEMLGLEVLGCPSDVCLMANDKYVTKQVCNAAGVTTPRGELLLRSQLPADIEKVKEDILTRWSVPFIVKPAREDNSFGVSLVKTEDDVVRCLENAFKYDQRVLVEQYIAGREVRVVALEWENGDGMTLEILPKIEYFLEDIRTHEKKFSTQDGKMGNTDDDPAKAIMGARVAGDRQCPADLEPEVHERLDFLAKTAHAALGCKYYSLYDVRIDENGICYLLEAALFCSFSPLSVVVGLAAQSPDERLQPHPKLFEKLMERSARLTRERRERGSAPAGSVVGSLKA